MKNTQSLPLHKHLYFFKKIHLSVDVDELFIYSRLFVISLKTIVWLFVSHKGFVIISFWSICALLLALIVFIIPFTDVWIYFYRLIFIVQFLTDCTIWILVKIFVLLFPIKIFQIFHLMRKNINNYYVII